MKNIKKILSLLIVITLISGTLVIAVGAEQTSEIIKTGQEFIDKVIPGGSYIIEGTETLSDGTLGIKMPENYVPKENFYGTITGGTKGNKIELTGNELLSSVTKSSNISNLVLIGNVVSNTQKDAGKNANGNHGTLVSKIGAMGTSVIINNITNYADITSNTMDYSVGGIVGQFWADGLTLSNCTNYGRVISNAEFYTGGIIGSIRDVFAKRTKFEISGCTNYGDIESSGSCVAGILGGMHKCDEKENFIIKDCGNYGNIKSSFAHTVDKAPSGIISRAGGIQIIKCFNAGDISSKGTTAMGIAAIGFPNVEVHDCFNIGNVGTAYGTGIVRENGQVVTLDNCYNLGVIQSKKEIGNTGTYPNTYTSLQMKEFQKSNKLPTGFSDTVWEYTVPEETFFSYPQLKGNGIKLNKDDGFYIPTPGFSGTGTKVDPYIIKNESGFSDVIKLMKVGSYAELSKDIVLNSSYKPLLFTGNLDGKNYSITCNMDNSLSDTPCSTALFAGVANGANISNLSIKGSFVGNGIDKPECGTASLIDVVAPNRGFTVKNIKNYAEVKDLSGASVGGIIGAIRGDGSANYKITVDNCINYANINGATSGTGGIIGITAKHNNLLSEVIFSNCTNYGNVTGQSGVGGIIGLNGGSANRSCQNLTISTCSNYGDITSQISDMYAAGIVGGNRAGLKEINNSLNAGKIKSENISSGIISTYFVNKTYDIKNCINIGEVYTNTNNKFSYGITNGGTATGTVTDCYNVGKLTSAGGYNYPVSISMKEVNCYYILNDYKTNTKEDTFNAKELTIKELKEQMPEFTVPDNYIYDSSKGFYYPQLKTNKLTLSSLELKTKLDILVPLEDSINVPANTFRPLNTNDLPIGDDNIDLTDKNGMIYTDYMVALARIPETRNVDIEYGILLNTEDKIPDILNANIKAKALKKSMNGAYGILFYGSGYNPQIKYTARPYLIYEVPATGLTGIVYGTHSISEI